MRGYCDLCMSRLPCPCGHSGPLIFMTRGLPGAGKSTLARELARQNSGCVVSADDYFVGDDGVYRHDRSRIRQAHADARRRMADASDDWPCVVVDNTHITHRDMHEYFLQAAHLAATVVLVEPTTPWAWDPDECARRNVHGVPLDAIRGMLSRFQPMTTSEAQAVVTALREELDG